MGLGFSVQGFPNLAAKCRVFRRGRRPASERKIDPPPSPGMRGAEESRGGRGGRARGGGEGPPPLPPPLPLKRKGLGICWP